MQDNEDTIELAIGQVWRSYTGVIPEYLNKEIVITDIFENEVFFKYLHNDNFSQRYLDTFDHYFEFVRDHV